MTAVSDSIGHIGNDAGNYKTPAQYHFASTPSGYPAPPICPLGWVMQGPIEMPEDIPLVITIWLCPPSHIIHIPGEVGLIFVSYHLWDSLPGDPTGAIVE